ncbi:MAG: T9SS type A sorting domain-containing protein [Bacteroidota bacterium]
MKKLLVLFAFICFGLHGFSQQSTLPNGGFESWLLKPNWGYYEPTGGFFHTLNILDTVPTSAGITVYPSSDTMHAGLYSARCITRLMVIAYPLVVTIPGVIGTLKINWAKSAAVLGEKFKWTTKPERFQGWYQSYPLNGDSTAAIVLFSKWNTSTKQRDTIAYNRIVFKTVVSTWTQFDEAINYKNATMPDSVTVLLLSCAGYSASNMMGSVGQPGSQAYFDDVTLTGVFPWGVENLLTQTLSLSVSPNPASDHINVTLEKAIQDGSFEIYNVQGRLVGKHQMNDVNARFDISALPSGMYYYRMSKDNTSLGTGSFIVNR